VFKVAEHIRMLEHLGSAVKLIPPFFGYGDNCCTLIPIHDVTELKM
jgi:hypothetical protein